MPVEIMEDESTSLAMHIAELDQQIATARAYPRPRANIIGSEIEAMATENEDVAQECIYALKRGGKAIIGPSVRFAEIVAVAYGNSEYASRVIDEGQEFVTAQAVFRDLERNIRVSVESKRRIVDSNGNRYGIDMIGVTSNAAMSIAMRNAILKGVPRLVWGGAYAKAQALIAGTFETIEKRRGAALAAFKKLGVTEDLVLALLEKKRIDEIEPEDLLILRGTLQAIKDQDTTVNATFGHIRTDKAKANVGGQLDKGRARDAETKNSEAQQGAKTGGSAGRKPAGGGDEHRGTGGETGRGDIGADEGTDGKNAGSDDQRRDGSGEGDGADQGADGEAGGPDSAGGSGAGVEADQGSAGTGGASSGGTASGDQGSTPEPVSEKWAPFLVGIEGSELTKLENFARALDKATNAVKVSGAIAEFAPLFESSAKMVENAFAKMSAEANKAVRGAKSKL